MTALGDVFVVDDNPNNLSLLTSILRAAGYTVRMAVNGQRALQAVQARQPELMLVDVNMPVMDGYTLCERLRADPRTAEVPVILLSALDDVQDKLRGFGAGAVDYVTKPFHAEEVLARVGTQLKLARLRRELEEKNRELQARHDELAAAWEGHGRMFATLAEALPGATLDGKYRLEEKIGEGGFAVVYRATHLALERPVAVKVLRPSLTDAEAQLRGLRQEGISATRVNHPNAVAVLDSGVTRTGVGYLVMELLSGRSLAEELQQGGPVTPARAGQIMVPVCRVLAAAHAQGLLHRDIKPANIFLSTRDGVETVKVVDFGIARLFGEAAAGAHTTIGQVVGTPVYMSPERLLGKPHDGRADVYSVGVTLYQMLAGQSPFTASEGGVAALILACMSEDPIPLMKVRPDLPRALCVVVMSAMARNPADRPDVAALAGELELVCAAGDVGPADIPRLGKWLADTVDIEP
jgi:CheY-like chemotaxis protein